MHIQITAAGDNGLSDFAGMSMSSHGLPRKFRLLFIVQVLLVTLFIGGGLWLVMAGSNRVVFNALLKEDAAFFWEQRRQDPLAAPTHSRRQQGVLVNAEGTPLTGQVMPVRYLQLAPGFHDLADEGWLVWVEDGPEGRLIQRYERGHAQRIILLVVVVPAIVTLLGFYLAAWYSYRTSRRLVQPVNWLARQVADWDPRRAGSSALDSPVLPDHLTGETRQLADALRGMAQRVRDHIQREHEFTRDASHELRTPLTVIRMATDVALGDPELGRSQVRSLRRIQQAGRDMEAVLESQLLLAREADHETPLEMVAVNKVLEEEVAQARQWLDGRPIQIDLLVDDPDLIVTSSERAFRVVMRHLLENACQYTLEGRIRVTLEKGQVTVADTGIGMSPEQLDRAFEPFYRGNPSEGAGSGLGLSIVRRLCKRFEWRLTLYSEQQNGTCARIGLLEEGSPVG